MAGLYIHIPFCRSKCAYCDFYSTPSRNHMGRYVDALVNEARLRRGEIRHPYRTVYIGGGTPSILPLSDLRQLVDKLLEILNLDNVEEFTIEANPEDISDQFISEVMQSGINRISIGIQSFDDRQLQSLGRSHSSAEARRALEILSASGINYSADLIYGLPDQSLGDWEKSLDTLLAYRPPHLSAYLLSYEPGTRLYARMIAGKVKETDETTAQEMYEHLCSAAKASGYGHYEISNFALSGFHSRHNSSYWDATPYLGLGVAAHSFDGSVRRFNPADISRYVASQTPVFEEEPATVQSRFNDLLITALRTRRGLALRLVEDMFGMDYRKRLLDDAAKYISDGTVLVNSADDTIAIAEKSWLRSDAIMRDLIRIDDAD